MHASLDGHGRQMQQLHQQAEQLRQDLIHPAHTQTPLNQEEVLKPLQQELLHRLQQAQGLDARLSQTQGALETAEQRLEVLTQTPHLQRNCF